MAARDPMAGASGPPAEGTWPPLRKVETTKLQALHNKLGIEDARDDIRKGRNTRYRRSDFDWQSCSEAYKDAYHAEHRRIAAQEGLNRQDVPAVQQALAVEDARADIGTGRTPRYGRAPGEWHICSEAYRGAYHAEYLRVAAQMAHGREGQDH